MAERRMFAKTIIDSDAFLDMPLSAQALYFHLSMRADDEGFVNSPKKIQRVVCASDDDMKILVAKNFVIPFETGIVVIKHWRIHNYIRADRLVETKYQDERALLDIKENGSYTISQCLSDGSQVSVKCQSDGSIGKDSIGKDSIGKKYTCAFDEFWKNYPRKKEKIKAYKQYLCRLRDGYSEDQLLTACINYAAECEREKKEQKYIKLGATFLSVNEPFVDYLKGDKHGNSESGTRADVESDEDLQRRYEQVMRQLEEDGEDEWA